MCTLGVGEGKCVFLQLTFLGRPNNYGPYRVKCIGKRIFGEGFFVARRSFVVFGIASNGLENWSV